MQNESSLNVALDAYFAGDASPEALDLIRRWLREHPSREAELDLVRAAWRATAVQRVDAFEAKRARFSEMVVRQETANPGADRRPWENVWSGTPSTSRAAFRWFATAIILVATVFGTKAVLNNARQHVASQVYVTRLAQQTTVVLEDGTRVLLAPQTKLTVGRRFGRTDRTVALVGEAYFDVRNSAGTPFIVRTGTVSTKVLGTTFAIRRYAEDSAAQVAVMSGKVLAGGRNAAILSAGVIARITDSTATSTIPGDARSYTDWSSRHLVFEGASVSALLETVGRWYGFQFRLSDSVLAAKHVSATIKMSDSTDMIRVLKSVLEVEMTFEGSTVTLTPRDDIRSIRRRSVPSIPTRKETFKPTMEVGK